MRRSIALTLCTLALMVLALGNAQADNLEIELEFGSGDWSLYTRVIDTAGPANGSLGISAVRALIDGIDFGTGGNAVTIASGIGAINPVNGGPPVLNRGGGIIEIVYGQDISATGSIVPNVGVGSRRLVASGSYSGSNPSFAADPSNPSLTSQGLFLTSTTPGGGPAIDPDNNVLKLTPLGVPADLNTDGFVDGLDLGILLGNFDQNGIPPSGGELNGTDPVDGLDLGILLGSWNPPALSALSVASVPEPTSLALFAVAGTALLATRRTRS